MALYVDEYGNLQDSAYNAKVSPTPAVTAASLAAPAIASAPMSARSRQYDATRYANEPLYAKAVDAVTQDMRTKYNQDPATWVNQTDADIANWQKLIGEKMAKQASDAARVPIVNAAPPVYSVNAALPKPTTTSMFGAMPTAGPAFGANAGVNNAMGAYVMPGTNGGTFSGMQAAARQQALAPSLVQQLLGQMFGSSATQQVQSAIDKRNNPAPTTTTPATTTSSSGNSMFGSFNPSMQNTFVNPAMTGYRGGGGSQWRGMWG